MSIVTWRMKNSFSVHVKLGSKKVYRVVTFETAARSLRCSELTCFDISQSCKWQLSVTISTSSSFIRTRPFVLEPKCFFLNREIYSYQLWNNCHSIDWTVFFFTVLYGTVLYRTVYCRDGIASQSIHESREWNCLKICFLS